MLSVNTNAGALAALRNLNATNSQLNQVQNRINTGLKVAGAKDDGGAFAIAQSMRADIAGLGAVKNSLSRVGSVVDTALAAGEAVSDLLVEMKAKALAAADTSLDTSSRTALNEDYKALRDQITTIVSNAEFGGTNLLNNTTTEITALANADASSVITVVDEDLTISGGIIGLTSTSSFASSSQADDLASTIGDALDSVNQALARLGTASKALEVHDTFVTKLSDELEKGIGNLVDADLAKESAKLQALQVKQQLGIQALAIANSAPSTVLALFQ
ncbi:MAG: flagellin [Maricaulaceae bacterium]|jgi:flagellin